MRIGQVIDNITDQCFAAQDGLVLVSVSFGGQKIDHVSFKFSEDNGKYLHNHHEPLRVLNGLDDPRAAAGIILEVVRKKIRGRAGEQSTRVAGDNQPAPCGEDQ